jgi:hypothetical protein
MSEVLGLSYNEVHRNPKYVVVFQIVLTQMRLKMTRSVRINVNF